MQEPAITTPAKINLYLEVLAKRPDGYHDLETVFVPLPGLCDRLACEPLAEPGLQILCDDSRVPTGETNLVWKAALAFAAAARVAPQWRFRLDKFIPVAAGLGGGSSDAAAALRLLNRMHGEPLAPDVLHALAEKLGADVAFFLTPVPAVGRGTGALLTPVAVRARLPLILVNPGFPVATAWAYAHWRDVPLPAAPGCVAMLAALSHGTPAEIARHTFNSLEHAVLRKFPLLQLLLDWLRAQGCHAAHVSGSGATVYGICDEASLPELSVRVRREFELPLWVYTTVLEPGRTTDETSPAPGAGGDGKSHA